MSATDELRRLLDERGVEWVASGTDTCWSSAGGYPMRAWETTNGTHMRVADLTPEQAVDATLGRGTCHAVFEVDAMSEDERVGEYVCSECGETFNDGHGEFPHYCPECGRKVEP